MYKIKGISIATQAVLNFPQMARLSEIMQDVSKSVKDREKNTIDLRASILDLSDSERDAFILRNEFSKIEKQNEIELIRIKLNNAAKIRDEEIEKLVRQKEELRVTAKFFKLGGMEQREVNKVREEIIL